MRILLLLPIGFALLVTAPVNAAEESAAPPATAPAPSGASGGSEASGGASGGAPTPGEAFERAGQAHADADEAAYRRIVRIVAPDGYSEAYTLCVFASLRLHRAIDEHDVKGWRDPPADGGWDRNAHLSPGLPSPPSRWPELRETIRATPWRIDGHRAEPIGEPLLRSNEGTTMTVERHAAGWIVVLTDSTDPETVERFREAVPTIDRLTASINATIADINAGRLRTIREVNDRVFPPNAAEAKPNQ